jgi:hypothetical protein
MGAIESDLTPVFGRGISRSLTSDRGGRRLARTPSKVFAWNYVCIDIVHLCFHYLEALQHHQQALDPGYLSPVEFKRKIGLAQLPIQGNRL